MTKSAKKTDKKAVAKSPQGPGVARALPTVRETRRVPARPGITPGSQALAQRLEKCNLTHTQLAALLRVPAQYVSNWTNGRQRPGADDILALEKLWDINPDSWLNASELKKRAAKLNRVEMALHAEPIVPSLYELVAGGLKQEC